MGGKCGICIKNPTKKDINKANSDSKDLKKTAIESEKAPILDPNSIYIQNKPLYDPQSSIIVAECKQSIKTAIDSDNLNELSNIISSGFPINEPINHEKFTALHYACKTGKEAIVKLLIENIEGAAIDIQDENERWTPLMIAGMNGHIEIVKYLLEKKANRSLLSEEGKNAYIYAEQAGFADIANMLKKNC